MRGTRRLVALAGSGCIVASLMTLGTIFGSVGPSAAQTAELPCSNLEAVLAHADGSVTVVGTQNPQCSTEPFLGSLSGHQLNAPIVGLAATPAGGGYWLAGADGGIFTLGNAPFDGSLGNLRLNAPIVGIARTPDGGGYWLAASDGGVFAFGDARFFGSTGGVYLPSPVVAITADDATGGYWLTAADGAVYAFNAPSFGSLDGHRLNAPIRFMTSTPDAGGYRMVGSDGGVFDFGDAQFYGSAASPGSGGWDALSVSLDGGGYWLYASNPSGVVTYEAFGDATNGLVGIEGDSSGAPIVGAATLGQQNGPFINVPPAPQSSLYITQQPVNETVNDGSVVTFSASAAGTPNPTVQWQVSTNYGASFFNIANATQPDLTFTTVSSESGGEYRAVFTNSSGSVITNVVTLTVVG